jgi:hypothetical protein
LTILGIAAADVTALKVAEGMWVLAMAKDECVLATGLFELGSGHEARVVEEESFVRCRCDPEHGAHLGVRNLAAAERVADRRHLGELASDADAIARSGQGPTDAPGEPVRT